MTVVIITNFLIFSKKFAKNVKINIVKFAIIPVFFIFYKFKLFNKIFENEKVSKKFLIFI